METIRWYCEAPGHWNGFGGEWQFAAIRCTIYAKHNGKRWSHLKRWRVEMHKFDEPIIELGYRCKTLLGAQALAQINLKAAQVCDGV